MRVVVNKSSFTSNAPLNVPSKSSSFKNQLVKVLKDENTKKQDILDAEFHVIDDSPLKKSKLEKDKLLQDLERHTILLKNSGKGFLNEKINQYSRNRNPFESEENYSRNSTYQNKEQNSSQNFRHFNDPSFEEIKKKILHNYNLASLQKLLEKNKDIIASLGRASRGVFDFIDKMAVHLSSLSDEERLQNMTSLKGLLFDGVG